MHFIDHLQELFIKPTSGFCVSKTPERATRGYDIFSVQNDRVVWIVREVPLFEIIKRSME